MPTRNSPPTVPGPPGLAPSRSSAEAAEEPYSSPASSKKPNGSNDSDHGASSSSGVPNWARKRSP